MTIIKYSVSKLGLPEDSPAWVRNRETDKTEAVKVSLADNDEQFDENNDDTDKAEED